MNLILSDMQSTQTIQFSAVPVTLGTVSDWYSIYYLPIYNLIAGEIIEIYAEGQVANNLNYDVELAQCLELRTSVSGGTEPLGSPGGYTGVINGWDFSTSENHYGRFSKGDCYLVPANIAEYYLVMRLRCRSTGALPGNAVTVDAGQGLMYYKRFTPQ